MAVYFGPDLLLLDRLALGGMAEVFRARQLGTAGFKKTVAVKRILPHYAARTEFKEMFQREMNLCARLQHPNIVQVYRNGEHEDYLYLVMEFVHGRTVDQILQRLHEGRLKLPIPIACYVACEVAKGLQYAHTLRDETGRELNIVHRDISPQNIMVGFQGEVKIVDFGIARIADSANLTKTGELKGKIGYIAPERWEGGSIPDARSDLYALGIVLHEMLTQRALFSGGDTFEVMHKIVSGEVPSLRSINTQAPELLEKIVSTMLAVKPDDRYQSAEEFLRDLSLLMHRDYPEFVPADCSQFLQDLFRADDAVPLAPEGQLAEATARSEAARRHTDGTRTELAASGSRSGTRRFSEILIGDDFSWVRAAIYILISINLLFIYREQITNAAVALLPAPKIITLQQEAVKPSRMTVNGGMLAWFKADSLGLQDGASITHWSDATFGGNDAAQDFVESQPVLKANAINGLPAVHFAGNDYLTADKIASAIRPLSSITVVLVGRVDVDSKQFFWSLHAPNTEIDIARLGMDPNSRLEIKFSRVPKDLIHTPPVDTHSFAIYSSIIALPREALPGQAILYRNGKVLIDKKIEVNSTFEDARYFSLGQEWDRNFASDFLRGDIAEVIVFGTATSSDQLNAIENYLSKKYAVALER